MSAINYLINRLNTYPIEKTHKNREKGIIQYILQQNYYQMNKSINKKLNKNNTVINQDHIKENTYQQNKWITFTYFGHKIQ
jgi:hypothetical protein